MWVRIPRINQRRTSCVDRIVLSLQITPMTNNNNDNQVIP
eukprot:UN03003